MRCGVDHIHDSDPALLWLWCRPVAVAPIRPLAWEPLYTVGAALKKEKNKKAKETNKKESSTKCIYNPHILKTQMKLH